MVLLTANEKLWISGHHNTFSKGYQRKLKHDIKNKLQQFYQLELPLLIEKGFISNSDLPFYNNNGVTNSVTTNCNVTANCNNIDDFNNKEKGFQNKTSLGRDLDPRPLPYQGNALARLSYQGKSHLVFSS